MKRIFYVVLLVFCTVFSISGCAGNGGPTPDEIYDPIEPVNRGIFWFNDGVDSYFFEPVARGYDYIVPEFIQTGIGNFFDNLEYPRYLLSDLVQLKFGQAATHTGRFLVNSTVGVAGLIDVAEDLGLERHREDFGISLAYHGVSPGAYIVLPFIGPSNVRDGIGSIVDFFTNPFTYIGSYGLRTGEEDKIAFGSRGVEVIHTRAGLIEAIEAAKDGTVDYYLGLQSAYYQTREVLLHDGNVPDKSSEDIFADDEEALLNEDF